MGPKRPLWKTRRCQRGKGGNLSEVLVPPAFAWRVMAHPSTRPGYPFSVFLTFQAYSLLNIEHRPQTSKFGKRGGPRGKGGKPGTGAGLYRAAWRCLVLLALLGGEVRVLS